MLEQAVIARLPARACRPVVEAVVEALRVGPTPGPTLICRPPGRADAWVLVAGSGRPAGVLASMRSVSDLAAWLGASERQLPALHGGGGVRAEDAGPGAALPALSSTPVRPGRSGGGRDARAGGGGRLRRPSHHDAGVASAWPGRRRPACWLSDPFKTQAAPVRIPGGMTQDIFTAGRPSCTARATPRTRLFATVFDGAPPSASSTACGFPPTRRRVRHALEPDKRCPTASHRRGGRPRSAARRRPEAVEEARPMVLRRLRLAGPALAAADGAVAFVVPSWRPIPGRPLVDWTYIPGLNPPPPGRETAPHGVTHPLARPGHDWCWSRLESGSTRTPRPAGGDGVPGHVPDRGRAEAVGASVGECWPRPRGTGPTRPIRPTA